jgi:hypothetical protein
VCDKARGEQTGPAFQVSGLDLDLPRKSSSYGQILVRLLAANADCLGGLCPLPSIARKAVESGQKLNNAQIVLPERRYSASSLLMPWSYVRHNLPLLAARKSPQLCSDCHFGRMRHFRHRMPKMLAPLPWTCLYLEWAAQWTRRKD